MVTDSTGNVFVVDALRDEKAQSALASGQKLWNAYKGQARSGAALLRLALRAPERCARAKNNCGARSDACSAQPARPAASRRRCRISTVYAASSHSQLRNVMVELTAQVETASHSRSGTLRMVQVFGIVAAVLLLGAIFFYFARNMRKEEAVSNRQRKETATFCAR
jgi:hypothetical protein